jgi:hypothetical protein
MSRTPVALVLAGLVASGCGSNGGGDVPRDAGPDRPADAPPRPTIPDGGLVKVPFDARPVDLMAVQSTCEKYAAAACPKLKECAPRSFDSQFANLAQCQSATTRLCVLLLSSPGYGATLASVSACVTSVSMQTCADNVPVCPSTSRTNLVPVPAGTLQAGNPCFSSFQCRSGLYCHLGPTLDCGLCSPPLPAGADCIPGLDACEVGSCLQIGSGLRGLCPTQRRRGEACGVLDTCERGTTCTMGACMDTPPPQMMPMPMAMPGKAGDDCSRTACDNRLDLYCNRLTMKCDPLPPLAKAGEACGSLLDGSGATIQCVGGTTCLGVMGLTRTCVADLEAGKPCNPLTGARCANPNVCTNGTCQARDFPVCQ